MARAQFRLLGPCFKTGRARSNSGNPTHHRGLRTYELFRSPEQVRPAGKDRSATATPKMVPPKELCVLNTGQDSTEVAL